LKQKALESKQELEELAKETLGSLSLISNPIITEEDKADLIEFK
jgi:hypothetical protein